MNRNFDQYRETQIKTASPGRLLLMLYDGAVRFINLAIKSLQAEPKDLEIAHNNIIKVQNIITELTITLNMEKGGDIAVNLKEIYSFMRNHLVEGNLKKDANILIEVKGLIEELRDGWREVVKKEEGFQENQVSSLKNINIKG
ncbi:MAG: flagellar export chaperone FliS [Candidatus Muirbacterium halophilum]|nr:flagellar export chaperone FliS [Candidatus Muirbacterium halophilum]MCK9474754.1 flagellar export chaperone FliS [Candidatus Muirbacterium halophilum]